MLELSNIKRTANLYFIRHGQTHSNSSGIIGGGLHHDPKLTELGRKQAENAGFFLKKSGVLPDLMICSILSRASDTAKIMAKALYYNKEIVHTKDLIEVSTGIFTDLTYNEVQEKYPNVWIDFKEKLWDGVPEAENSLQIKTRLSRYFDYLFSKINEGNYKTIITVCHWGTLQWIFNMITGADLWKPVIQFKNCSISKLIIKKYGDGIMTTSKGKFPKQDSVGGYVGDHFYMEWDYIGLDPNVFY